MLDRLNDTLFHGSDIDRIRTLKPYKPRGDRRDERAVYATDDVDYAIFMAVIGSNGWGGWNHNHYEGRGFYVLSRYLRQMRKAVGTVYLVDRELFTPNGGSEFKSLKPVPVLGSFAVTHTDLPHDLTEIDWR